MVAPGRVVDDETGQTVRHITNTTDQLNDDVLEVGLDLNRLDADVFECK